MGHHKKVGFHSKGKELLSLGFKCSLRGYSEAVIKGQRSKRGDQTGRSSERPRCLQEVEPAGRGGGVTGNPGGHPQVCVVTATGAGSRRGCLLQGQHPHLSGRKENPEAGQGREERAQFLSCRKIPFLEPARRRQLRTRGTCTPPAGHFLALSSAPRQQEDVSR